MRLQPRPHHRQSIKSKKIDVHKVSVPVLKMKYSKAMEDNLDIEQSCDPSKYWVSLRNTIHQTALDTIGLKQGQNQDWFKDSWAALEPVLEEKRSLLLKVKARPPWVALAEYRSATVTVQKTVHACVQDYWASLCNRIESARDAGNIRGMYEAINTATGPTSQTTGILKQKDGTVFLFLPNC